MKQKAIYSINKVKKVVLLFSSFFCFPLNAFASSGGAQNSISSLFYPTVNFIITLFVLFYLYKKYGASKFVEKKNLVVTKISEAKEKKDKADKLLSDAKSRLKNIDMECKELKERLDKETDIMVEHILEVSKENARRIEIDSDRQIENSLSKASHEMSQAVLGIALDRAKEELRNITEEDDACVRADALDSFN